MAKSQTYSRLKRIEKQKNLRSAYLYIFLTIILVAGMFFGGLPLVTRFAGFLFNLGDSGKPVEILDKTPPPPPTFENVPEFTNEEIIALEGNAEAGSSVSITINGTQKEIVAGSQGDFSFKVDLQKGENAIFAFSNDLAGNKSADSRRYTIVFDNEPPKLSIDSPSDSQIFSGKEKNIKVTGLSEENSRVTINDRVAIVSPEGKYEATISLSDGSNTLTVKAIDQAGNETQKEISITYFP